MMKMVDDRDFRPTVQTLMDRIKYLIRECEKYNIDYDSYVDPKDLEWVIEVLECCISHKDSKYIIRRE